MKLEDVRVGMRVRIQPHAPFCVGKVGEVRERIDEGSSPVRVRMKGKNPGTLYCFDASELELVEAK